MFRHLLRVRAPLILIGLLVLPAFACDFSLSTASITNAVMAKDVKGVNFEPVGITDTYTAEQKEFHAVVTVSNAPSDTGVRAVWTAVDVGSAAAPNSKIDELELKVEGSRNIDFTLTPKSGRWPPGTYKADIYLNGKLDRTLNFTVEGTPQAKATDTPRAQAPTATVVQAQASPTAAPRSSPSAGVATITNAVLARDSTPLTLSPLGVTDTFLPNAVIHVNVAVSNAPSGTTIKAVWTAVDVGNAAPKNSTVGDYQATAQGTENVDIFIRPNPSFAIGRYKADVYLNGKLDRTLNYTVKEGIAPFVTPTPKAIGSCPPPPTPDVRLPIIARKLTTAEGVTSDGEPVNVTRQFKPSSVFYAIVAIENAPANSKIKAIWYALDTGGAEACNTRFGETEITTSGTRNVWFSFKAPDKYPVGIYKVEIYVNGSVNIDIDFRVF